MENLTTLTKTIKLLFVTVITSTKLSIPAWHILYALYNGEIYY